MSWRRTGSLPTLEDPADEPDRDRVAGARYRLLGLTGRCSRGCCPRRSLRRQQNFEGLSNQDNFNIFGVRVNPPDPVGDVGPNHYVEMVNLAVAASTRRPARSCSGRSTSAPLWAASPSTDCTDPSGDPVVVYDQLADRWILTQFTTRGLDDPAR